MTIDPARALERAREHCFMSGVGDVGEALCGANMPYGLAKIQWVQRELGLPDDASFIGAPDATVTRNTNRWLAGFGYGGRVQWSGEIAVLDIKSNACGMIVVALDDPPPNDLIRQRARELMAQPIEVEGVSVEFDLGEGNHFLDVCEVVETYGDAQPEAKTYAVIHSSGHEHREHSPLGPGIYYDASDDLRKLAELRETPWGPLHVLRGERAREWFEVYTWCQNFALARREALARALLGPLTVVCNRTHQGLSAINDAILGCYTFDDDDLARGQLFPLTLSPDLPVYLVEPLPNLDAKTLETTGFLPRAQRHGLVERLCRANLLPHGGGYSYSQFAALRGVVERDGRRGFELLRPDGTIEVAEDARPHAFGYRGDEVRQRLLELGLGRPRIKTEIRYILEC